MSAACFHTLVPDVPQPATLGDVGLLLGYFRGLIFARVQSVGFERLLLRIPSFRPSACFIGRRPLSTLCQCSDRTGLRARRNSAAVHQASTVPGMRNNEFLLPSLSR